MNKMTAINRQPLEIEYIFSWLEDRFNEDYTSKYERIDVNMNPIRFLDKICSLNELIEIPFEDERKRDTAFDQHGRIYSRLSQIYGEGFLKFFKDKEKSKFSYNIREKFVRIEGDIEESNCFYELIPKESMDLLNYLSNKIKT